LVQQHFETFSRRYAQFPVKLAALSRFQSDAQVREVMSGMGYKSVSTVAVHIDGLIDRGYLRKRDNSARSLEVISLDYKAGSGPTSAPKASGGAAKEKWLVEAVNQRFTQYEQSPNPQLMDELYVLIGALKVLGFDGAYEAMRSKLASVVRR
jgi:SOS-response transcriptional repressor LexA